MAPIFVTSPDRAGLAIATGALIGGVGWAMGGLAGGTRDGLDLAALLVGGFAASALAIGAVGMPAWWLARRRGPVAAGVTGAVVVALIALSAQTYGLGLAMPAEDGWTRTARWLSALTVAGIAGLGGAFVALAMWLVAYRRL